MSARSLPKINHPIFELELPSTGEKVKYRPFTVKEEKILLIAQETDDIKQAILSIEQIINNCLIDVGAESLSMFDIEYILLQLRSKSVDNNVTFTVKDPETEESIKLELDLNNVEIIRDDNHTNKIDLGDGNMLMLRYPTLREFVALAEGGLDDPESNYNVMVNCIDMLVTEEEVFKMNEFTPEEVGEFVDDLSGDVIAKIRLFYDTMPKMRHEIEYENSNGNKKTFVLEGLETFFI